MVLFLKNSNLFILQQAYLFSKHEVSICGHGGPVSDKVCHGLHDIPGVLPPGEASEDSELNAHQPQAHPREQRRAPRGLYLQT